MMDSERRSRMEAIRQDQCKREKDCAQFWSYDLGNEPKNQETPLDKLKRAGISHVIPENGADETAQKRAYASKGGY